MRHDEFQANNWSEFQTSRQYIKKKDVTLPTKVQIVCIVKAMIFAVVMYGCERRAVRKLNAKELMPSNCDFGEYS